MAGLSERLPDEGVEYRLYPKVSDHKQGIEIHNYLEEQLDLYLAHLSKLFLHHIWQNEPFELHVGPDSLTGVPYIFGRTCYGDNIEDEWFIVFLLFELTKAFPELLIKINDSDGEFLLIEAAEHLPKWLNPETAENRVYIYEGNLHIIPQPTSPADLAMLPPGIPDIESAIRCIRDNTGVTVAPSKIQNAIRRRIADFPGKSQASIHKAHCYIPASLAAVFDHSPGLVAPIVSAFYSRDPIDLKACVTMKHFRPGTRVMRQVRFTRCLYAQLMQQKFTPDKRSGWNLPSSSNPKFKSYDLGMKLAHGAEILCSKCGSSTYELPDDFTSAFRYDARWQRFVDALTEKGYFRGELEGSRMYSRLLDDAKKYFKEIVCSKKGGGPTAGQKILAILSKAKYDIEEMRKQEKNLPKPDDDSWMTLTPAGLDDILKSTSGGGGGIMTQSSDSFDLSAMTESMKSFMDNISSFEGAEVPHKVGDDDVQLDPNSFIQSMQKMFDFDDSDGGSSTDMSEYGSDDELELSMKPKPSPPKKTDKKKKHRSSSKASGARLSSGVANGQDDDVDEGEMKEYMKVMDQQLAKTTIGQSFEQKPKAPPRKKRSGTSNGTAATANGTATNGVSSKPKPQPKGAAPKATFEDEFEDMYHIDSGEEFEPVDVDLTLVKNLLESYGSQQGLPGPTSNILGSMGIHIPKNKDQQS